MLKARLENILPDLRRLYNAGEAGELSPNGDPSGIFVKIVLSADKPFMRKLNGLLSHNANCFGPPSCSCCDEDLYNDYLREKCINLYQLLRGLAISRNPCCWAPQCGSTLVFYPL